MKPTLLRIPSICLFLVLFIVSSCSLSSSNFESKLNWLLGKWESSYNSFRAEEEWTWNNDLNEFQARGFMINAKDTLYNQQMKIHEENNELFLSVHTADKSKEIEAFFKLIKYDSDSLVFKNIFNRSPKFIIYSKKGALLETKAIGEKNGLTEIDLRSYYKITKDK